MFIAIFIEAVIISAFFEQQERRHKLEREIEYEKLGIKMPAETPKLPMLESIANAVVGLIVAEFGGFGLLALLGIIQHAGHFADKYLTSGYFANEVDFAAAFLAGGIALIMLGVKSIRANFKYRRSLVSKI